MKDASVVANLAYSAARTLGAVAVEFAKNPVSFAVRIHNVVSGALLIAFVLVEAIRLARLILSLVAAA
jgi:hypothetical protein